MELRLILKEEVIGKKFVLIGRPTVFDKVLPQNSTKFLLITPAYWSLASLCSMVFFSFLVTSYKICSMVSQRNKVIAFATIFMLKIIVGYFFFNLTSEIVLYRWQIKCFDRIHFMERSKFEIIEYFFNVFL